MFSGLPPKRPYNASSEVDVIAAAASGGARLLELERVRAHDRAWRVRSQHAGGQARWSLARRVRRGIDRVRGVKWHVHAGALRASHAGRYGLQPRHCDSLRYTAASKARAYAPRLQSPFGRLTMSPLLVTRPSSTSTRPFGSLISDLSLSISASRSSRISFLISTASMPMASPH